MSPRLVGILLPLHSPSLGQWRLRTGAERLKFILEETVGIAEKVRLQERHMPKKIYSLHEPEVCCMGKVKDRACSEFGQRAAVVITNKGNGIVNVEDLPDNPYDGPEQKRIRSKWVVHWGSFSIFSLGHHFLIPRFSEQFRRFHRSTKYTPKRTKGGYSVSRS